MIGLKAELMFTSRHPGQAATPRLRKARLYAWHAITQLGKLLHRAQFSKCRQRLHLYQRQDHRPPYTMVNNVKNRNGISRGLNKVSVSYRIADDWGGLAYNSPVGTCTSTSNPRHSTILVVDWRHTVEKDRIWG